MASHTKINPKNSGDGRKRKSKSLSGSKSNKKEKLTEKGLFIKFLKRLQEKKKLEEKEWASLDSNKGNVSIL